MEPATCWKLIANIITGNAVKQTPTKGMYFLSISIFFLEKYKYIFSQKNK